jgi:outer membrane protein OmpA-like peptidoglycan-associated protein
VLPAQLGRHPLRFAARLVAMTSMGKRYLFFFVLLLAAVADERIAGDKQTPCEKASVALRAALRSHVGGFVANIGTLNVNKHVLGTKVTLTATTAPRLDVKTEVISGGIKVDLSLHPATFEGSFDAGVFGSQHGRATLPKRSLSTRFRVACVSSCLELGSALVNGTRLPAALAAIINKDLFDALPRKIPLAKGLHISMRWPRLSFSGPPSNEEDQDADDVFMKLTLSSWGPSSASLGRWHLPFGNRGQFPSREFSMRCFPDDDGESNISLPSVNDTELLCGDDDHDSKVAFKVHFRSDSAKLEPSYHGNDGLLDTLAEALDGSSNVNSGCEIEIVGHTDCQGSSEHNLGLSRERADALAKWLARRTTAKIRAFGKGFSDPVCTSSHGMKMDRQCSRHDTDASDSCLVSNRRVEMTMRKLSAGKDGLDDQYDSRRAKSRRNRAVPDDAQDRQ